MSGFYLTCGDLCLQGVWSRITGHTLKIANAYWPFDPSVVLGRLVGGVAGALLAGVIPSRVNRWLLLSIILGLQSLWIITPWMDDVVLAGWLCAVESCGLYLTHTGM